MKRYLQGSLILAAVGAAIIFMTTVPNVGAHAVETGPAKFLRNHDKALQEAKKSGKPIFAFFQEVPG